MSPVDAIFRTVDRLRLIDHIVQDLVKGLFVPPPPPTQTALLRTVQRCTERL